jgi:rfaE bifunctional protein nucleotidyltransferase chain/domain
MTEKIMSLEQARAVREQVASRGGRVVFTNGCFDLLHVGHVRYLKEARGQGDLLIVGLNDDESTRRLKGEGRPFMVERDRAEILAALECVDCVVLFSEGTAENLVRALKPDIYVKGGNYRLQELPEADVVAEYDGEVYLTPVTRGRSTTRLISAIVACQQETTR